MSPNENAAFSNSWAALPARTVSKSALSHDLEAAYKTQAGIELREEEGSGRGGGMGNQQERERGRN